MPSPVQPFPDGLARARPSAKGVDAGSLGAWLDDVDAAGLELHAFMLWRDGAVVAEGWKWPYRPDRLRLTHSVTKSITACAIGLLIEERRLTLDDPVGTFFPDAEKQAADPRAARITVRHLLEMRTGHGAEVSGSIWRGIDSSWIDEFFRLPIVSEPGSTHVYSSAASYMLSAIVTRITGQTIHDYLKPRLFAPLGIAGERWDIGPDGFNPGGNGLSLTTADMLKIGILHADRGLWDGRPVLPRSWVEQATRPQGAPDYGYHWVIGDGYYAALGVFVQAVLVFPAERAVLAVQAAMEESKVLLPHIKRHFPSALAGPGNAAADAALARRLAAWGEVPTLPSPPGNGAALAGTRWRVDANPLDIVSLSFDATAELIGLTLEDSRGTHRIAAGLGRWIESVSTMPGASLHHGYRLDGTPVIAGARWTAADRLELVWHFVETAFRDTVTLHFTGDRLTMERRVNINSGARHWPVLGATRIAGD